jgi:hypothetical protein
MVQAGAASLFLGLAYRPELVLQASLPTLHRLAAFLQRYFPADFGFYVERLQEEGSMAHLPPLLDRAYILPEPPQAADLQAMCASLLQSLPDVLPPQKLDYEKGFAELQEILLNDLGFRSIFILADGVDAFPELNHNLGAAARAVAPLIEAAPSWAERRIFFKGFLPIELHSFFQTNSLQSAHIEWDAHRLAETIRRRVYKASAGGFGSMDAICTADVRDAEMLLSAACKPLPRHMLRLASRCFQNAYQDSQSPQIGLKHIHAAIAWYQANTTEMELVLSPQ